MKKVKSNKWGAICILGLEDLVLFKYSYYPKQSTNSMQSLQKFQRLFLFIFILQKKKTNSTTHVEPQKTINSQINPKKEEQSWRHNTY